MKSYYVKYRVIPDGAPPQTVTTTCNASNREDLIEVIKARHPDEKILIDIVNSPDEEEKPRKGRNRGAIVLGIIALVVLGSRFFQN